MIKLSLPVIEALTSISPLATPPLPFAPPLTPILSLLTYSPLTVAISSFFGGRGRGWKYIYIYIFFISPFNTFNHHRP